MLYNLLQVIDDRLDEIGLYSLLQVLYQLEAVIEAACAIETDA